MKHEKQIEFSEAEGKTIGKFAGYYDSEGLIIAFRDGTFSIIRPYDDWGTASIEDAEVDMYDHGAAMVEAGLITPGEYDKCLADMKKEQDRINYEADFAKYQELKKTFGETR